MKQGWAEDMRDETQMRGGGGGEAGGGSASLSSHPQLAVSVFSSAAYSLH